VTDPLRPPSSAPDGTSPEPVAPLPAPSPYADDGAAEPPPLYDPYLHAPAPPPRAGLSRLAVCALAFPFLLGPVGAILGIVFGHYARREIERSGRRRSGYGLATVGMVLGVVSTMAYGGLLSYLVMTNQHRVDPAGDEPGVAAPDPARRTPTPQHDQPLDIGPIAPRHTKVKREGALTVVDVGVSSSSLSEELAKQRAEAASAGETMLVMTTAGRCAPCRGVDQSLADPLLQTALANVRLVRVDIQVFHEDLEQLKIPDEAIPGFFLLSLDLMPRDGVDGGEWDDDIAANIGPVLGAFVRGKYTQRRRPWHPIPSSGMTL
jgi:hypothetical protein